MGANKLVDLHIHSCYSDGTDNADELIDNIIKCDIDVFSVTDHDTVEFYNNVNYSKLNSIKLVTGIEFSCITDVGRCHILGYNIDLYNDKLRKIIVDAKTIRSQKLTGRLEYLEEQHGIKFSFDEINYLLSLTSAGKPHIAQLIVNKGLAKNISEAITAYLTNLPKMVDRISAEEAVNAIISASGIPVWAHPLGGEGEKRLDQETFNKQLKLLMSFGIQGLECYYSRYNDSERIFLIEQSKRNNLLISGGSDYHGKAKNISLGKLADSADCNINMHEKLTILNEV